MRVLADLHHFDLYHSFQLLFEDRLGWKLYRPIGYDWMNEGFWNLCPQEYPAVYQGYLSTKDGCCSDSLGPYWLDRPAEWARFATELVRVGKVIKDSNGLYFVQDKSKLSFQRGITLERFKQEHFDIIISSTPQHFESTEKLRQLYQPHAKHIVHIGSVVGCHIPPTARNIMTHALPSSFPKGSNYIIYGQEFNLNTFSYIGPTTSTKVRSYVHFPESQKLWEDTQLNWDFKFVGKTLAPLHETIIESESLANEIQKSGFTWHIKLGGESYGHILHNSYACGRPVVINEKDYIGSRGELLLEDLVTSIDITGLSPSNLRDKLIYAGRPDIHRQMCESAYSRFCEVVDFDNEFEKIKSFLERLQ